MAYILSINKWMYWPFIICPCPCASPLKSKSSNLLQQISCPSSSFITHSPPSHNLTHQQHLPPLIHTGTPLVNSAAPPPQPLSKQSTTHPTPSFLPSVILARFCKRSQLLSSSPQHPAQAASHASSHTQQQEDHHPHHHHHFLLHLQEHHLPFII